MANLKTLIPSEMLRAIILMAVVSAAIAQPTVPEVTKKPESRRVPLVRSPEIDIPKQPSTRSSLSEPAEALGSEGSKCSNEDPDCNDDSAIQPAVSRIQLYAATRERLGKIIKGAMGLTEKTLNRFSRKLMPSMSRTAVNVWAWPVKKVLKTVKGWINSVVGSLFDVNKNCVTLIGSFKGAIKYIGSIRVSDTKVCGLKHLRTGEMKKTLEEDKKFWDIDNFIHFKNFSVTVGSMKMDLNFHIPYLNDISGFTVILDDVTAHLTLKVPVGILPVVKSWAVTVDNPEGFKVESGPDANHATRVAATTVTSVVRPLLANAQNIINALNSLLFGVFKLPLKTLGL